MNCKPNQMCEFICGPKKGAIVQTIEIDSFASHFYGEAIWVVKAARPMLIAVGPNAGKYKSIAGAKDAQIRPIRPPEESETITTQQEQHA